MRGFNYGGERPIARIDPVSVAAQATDCLIQPLEIRERVVAGIAVHRQTTHVPAVEHVVAIVARHHLDVSAAYERVVPGAPMKLIVRVAVPGTAAPQNIVAAQTTDAGIVAGVEHNRVVQECRDIGICRFVACKQSRRIPCRAIGESDLLDLDAARQRIVVDENGTRAAGDAQQEAVAVVRARHRDLIRCYSRLEAQCIVAARVVYLSAGGAAFKPIRVVAQTAGQQIAPSPAIDPVATRAADQNIAARGSVQYASTRRQGVIGNALIERTRIPRRAVRKRDLHAACDTGGAPAGETHLRAKTRDVEHEFIVIAQGPDVVRYYRGIKPDFLSRSRGERYVVEFAACSSQVDIVSIAAGKKVVARSADEGIVAIAAQQSVIARPAIEHVVAGAALQIVVPAQSRQRAARGTGGQNVVPLRRHRSPGEQRCRAPHCAIVEHNLLDPAGIARKPILQRDVVGATCNRQKKRREVSRNDDVSRCDPRAKAQGVVAAARARVVNIVDIIIARARREDIGIVAGSAIQKIIPDAAVQRIVAGETQHSVNTAKSVDRIIA